MNAVVDPKTFPIFSGLLPNGSPRAYRNDIDFATATSKAFDLYFEEASGIIGDVQGMFVDNADNPAKLTIQFGGDSLHRVVIPPYSQALVPALAGKLPRVTVSTTALAGLHVYFYFVNVPLPFLVWGGASLSPGGASVISGTYTDRSGFIALGAASQPLAAANTARKALIIENPATESESLFINFNGPASLNAGATPDSFEILPGGSFNMDKAIATQAVTVTAATINHKYIAKELA